MCRIQRLVPNGLNHVTPQVQKHENHPVLCAPSDHVNIEACSGAHNLCGFSRPVLTTLLLWRIVILIPEPMSQILLGAEFIDLWSHKQLLCCGKLVMKVNTHTEKSQYVTVIKIRTIPWPVVTQNNLLRCVKLVSHNGVHKQRRIPACHCDNNWNESFWGTQTICYVSVKLHRNCLLLSLLFSLGCSLCQMSW